MSEDGQLVRWEKSLPLTQTERLTAQFYDWEQRGRGWQVQVTLRKQAQRWRLVDCLSIADGGGDRLDQDYPSGGDELAVLSESVVIVDAS